MLAAISVCHLMPAKGNARCDTDICSFACFNFQSTTHLSFGVVICAVQVVYIFMTVHLGQPCQPGHLCASQSVCCPSPVSSAYCAMFFPEANIMLPQRSRKQQNMA